MLQLAFDRLDIAQFGIFVVVLWMLWFVCNKELLGKDDQDSINFTSFNFL